MRVTDRTKLSEATGRALFNPVQFVSALFNGRVADGFLNRRSQLSLRVQPNGNYSMSRSGHWLRWVGGIYPTIDNVMSDMMRDAGFSWTSGFLTGNYDDQYATGQWHTNDRGYVLIFEGSRGPKQHNDEWQNLVCKHWDHGYSGIVMRYLRDLNGDVCPNTLDTTWPLAQNGLYKWWGFDVARGIITLLTLMPGCDRITKAELARPGNDRINEGVPDTDMASMAARYGGVIGSKSIAKLDSARNRYFKIDNGPHVGDRCYDIQYSPIWEDVGG